MSEIIGSKITLNDIFGDKYYFNIPLYQRPYSWQSDQVEQLFDDLLSSDWNKEYFLGTLILRKTEEYGTGFIYDVIDGQQRLTTIQILLACIRDVFDEKDFSDQLHKMIVIEENRLTRSPGKVKLDTREKELFKVRVQTREGTLATNIICKNTAQKNINSAVEVFKSKLGEIKSQEHLENLSSFIVTKCIMLYLITEEFEDAYRLFTIVNDRGLQLRRIDILKSLNLSPEKIAHDSEREHYSKLWESMENDLGSEGFEQLVSLIRTIEVKEKPKEDLLKEFDRKIFGENKISLGKEFIEYLYDYKDLYQSLLIDQDIELDLPNNDDKNEFWNLLNLMLIHFPSNEWIAAILLYYRKNKSDNILEFIKKLEYKVTGDWIIKETPTKRSVNIYSILREIEVNSSTNLIRSDVFKVDGRKLNAQYDRDIYGQRYAKYVLLKLELLSCDSSVERKFSGTISVEHVLPQNPKELSKWLTHFDSSQRRSLTNRIGNLVLLNKRKNSRASNKEFAEKKQDYFKPKITDFTRSLEVLSYDEWTPEVVKKRQSELVKLLTTTA